MMDVMVINGAAVENIKPTSSAGKLSSSKAWNEGQKYYQVAHNAYYTNLEIALANTWHCAKWVNPSLFSDVNINARTNQITTAFFEPRIGECHQGMPQLLRRLSANQHGDLLRLMVMGNQEIKDFFNGLAPHWDANEDTSDERILSLLQRIGIKKGDAVLDVACGTGRITSLLHDLSGADVIGVDISEKMIAIAKKKYEDKPWAHFECADFCAMKGEKEYDVIVIYNAYPHFLNPEELKNALLCCLKQGGLFAIVHSMGREQLRLHHEGVPSSVSRNLEKASIEAKQFDADFRTLTAEDDETHYLILGKKHLLSRRTKCTIDK